MAQLGYGYSSYGHGSYGNVDWCVHVLYEELPEKLKAQDQAGGGLYKKFVEAASVPMSRLRQLIRGFDELQDPMQIRLDLLRFYAASFGLEIDTAEAEAFQRMEADLFSRFRLLKGRKESFIVLARIHGFEASVVELWWDGTEYTETQPTVDYEIMENIP